MGAGASSAEVRRYVERWDEAVRNLDVVCAAHRKSIGDPAHDSHSPGIRRDSEVSVATPANAQHRHSNSILRDKRSESVGDQAELNASKNSAGRRLSASVQICVDTKDAQASDVSTIPLGHSNNPTPVVSPSAASKQAMRQRHLDIRKARLDLYRSYAAAPDATNTRGFVCGHFGAVAAALSFLLEGSANTDDRKKKVTVEDIFFAAHVPLGLLHQPSLCLTEMFDIVREFIDVDIRFRNQFDAELTLLDIAPVLGEVDGSNEVGDRQAKINIQDLRRAITEELTEGERTVRIVQYDPYIVEQALLLDQADDDEEGGALDVVPQHGGTLSSLGTLLFSPSARVMKSNAVTATVAKENEGKYGVITDMKVAVQHVAAVAEAEVGERITLKTQEIPLNTLYKAMRATSTTNHRARGYLTVGKRKSDSSAASCMWIFSAELSSGKVIGSLADGIHANAVSPLISPHVTAVAWAFHLLGGVRPNTHNHGKGLPVSDLIRTLKMPIDMFLGNDVTLELVYHYAVEYIRQDGHDIDVSICPILTKINKEDAVPTLSVFEFESILLDVKNANDDPESPGHIMIVQYDANIAHNVLGIASAPQWAVFAGYDEDLQLVRLIDGNSRQFAMSWTVRLDRLHRAITNYGYIMLSKRSLRRAKSATGSSAASSGKNTPTDSELQAPGAVGTLRFLPSTVQRRLDAVLQSQYTFNGPNEALPHVFTFPTTSIALTHLAVALSTIGFPTTVDDVLHNSTFDVNHLLASKLSIRAFGVAAEAHLASVPHGNQVKVEVINNDCEVGNNHLNSLGFINQLRSWAANRGTKALIVSFDKSIIDIFGTRRPFSEYGVITDFNERENTVTVSDDNPNRVYRVWTVPLLALHRAMGCVRTKAHRPRGLIILERLPAPIEGAARKFTHSIAPLFAPFSVSASPQIHSLSVAFAQLGYAASPEEIFYEAYLKTVQDQRRRGSQAFAWRDVEVSLAMLNDKFDARMLAEVGNKFLEARKAPLAIEEADDFSVDELGELFTEATEPNSDIVLLALYRTETIHGVAFGNSVALVESYDAATSTVTMLEVEFALFGARWSCPVSQLVDAANLDCEGRNDRGLVRISRQERASSPKLGMAPPPGQPSRSPRARGGADHPTFVAS